jgi:hypothetical protein
VATLDIDSDKGWHGITALKFVDDFSNACSSVRLNYFSDEEVKLYEPESEVIFLGQKWDVVVLTHIRTNPHAFSYTLDLFPKGFTKNITTAHKSLGELCADLQIETTEGSVSWPFPIPYMNTTLGNLIHHYRRQSWEFNIEHPENAYWLYYHVTGMISKAYLDLENGKVMDIYTKPLTDENYRDFRTIWDTPNSEYSIRTFPRPLSNRGFYNALFNKRVSFVTDMPFVIGNKYKLQHPYDDSIKDKEFVCIYLSYDIESSDIHKYQVMLGELGYDQLPGFQSGVHEDQKGG